MKVGRTEVSHRGSLSIARIIRSMMLHAAALAPCEDRDDEQSEGQRAKRPRNEDNGARPARAHSTGVQRAVHF